MSLKSLGLIDDHIKVKETAITIDDVFKTDSRKNAAIVIDDNDDDEDSDVLEVDAPPQKVNPLPKQQSEWLGHREPTVDITDPSRFICFKYGLFSKFKKTHISECSFLLRF